MGGAPAADPMYGTMYWKVFPSGATLQTNAIINTYYGVTGFGEGVVAGVTTDLADAAGDHFIIPVGGAGDYEISYAANGQQQSSGQVCQYAVFVNGTIVAASEVMAYWTIISIRQEPQCTMYVTLADGDEVSLRHQNITGTGGSYWDAGHLTIRRIAVA